MSGTAHRSFPAADPATGDTQCNSIPLRRVLLVDEQAHVLRVMRVNLERHGYEVDTALGADSALQQVRISEYEALIITSDLPDMSARQLCEAINLRTSASQPLVLIGASEGDQWIDDSMLAERLDKPVSLRWIVARLSEVFGDYNQ